MNCTPRHYCRIRGLAHGLVAGLAVLCLFFISAPAVQAAERVALIIGNSSYQKATELKNPRSDAEAMAKMLDGFGFKVIKGIDVDQFNFRTLVRAFTREIKGAKLALFYYAGHGLQVGQRNFLLPVDAELREESDLDFESLELGFILQQMEREKRTNIILMDACRDNPFAANLARNMGTRSSSIGRGLAPLETGIGTFVGFATQPGNVALDGQDTNSPFTKAIIKHLAEPGLDIGVLMRRVREEVIAETKGKQVPWSNSSLVGDSVILNQTARQIVVEPKAQPQNSSQPATSQSAATGNSSGAANNSTTVKAALELSFWNTIKDSNSPILLQSYIDQYPNGTFVGLARAMMVSQQGGQQVPAAKQKPKQQVAAVNPDQYQTTQQAAPKPVDTYAITRALQGELRRHRCIAARPDGIWGPKSRGALKRYSRRTGLCLASLEPTQQILDHLRSRNQLACPLYCGARYRVKGGSCVLKTCGHNKVLTRKGHCVAKSYKKPRLKKKKRKVIVEEEIIEEVIRKPRKKRRKKRENYNDRMFDNEDAECPQCSTL